MDVSSILDVSSKLWGSKKSQMRVYYCKMLGSKFIPIVCSFFGRSRCWSYMRAPLFVSVGNSFAHNSSTWLLLRNGCLRKHKHLIFFHWQCCYHRCCQWNQAQPEEVQKEGWAHIFKYFHHCGAFGRPNPVHNHQKKSILLVWSQA